MHAGTTQVSLVPLWTSFFGPCTCHAGGGFVPWIRHFESGACTKQMTKEFEPLNDGDSKFSMPKQDCIISK